MRYLRKPLLWFVVVSALCLQSGCRRATPIDALQSNPRAWEGKRVVVHGVSNGPCNPEGQWTEQGFSLTDTTGGRMSCISVFTTGALPAEGRWVRVEGVVRVQKGRPVTVEPTGSDMDTYWYWPVIEASSPWSALLQHLEGLFQHLDGLVFGPGPRRRAIPAHRPRRN
jgi:hypothetical protein